VQLSRTEYKWDKVTHIDVSMYHDQVDGPGERNAGNARQYGWERVYLVEFG